MIYRQLTHRLRLQYGPGRPDITSIRPRDRRTGRFLDAEDDPTLVDLTGAEVGIDVAALLAAGAIAPYTPPAAPESEPAKGKGARGG